MGHVRSYVRLAALTLVLSASHCAPLDQWDPQFQPTPNAYGPCGAVWLSCDALGSTMAHPICCPKGYACPAKVGDECPFVGGDFGARRTDAGR